MSEWRPQMFKNIDHVFQNIRWHREYSNDLEDDEIVPFNAFREKMDSYWWVGESRWRSRKQIMIMSAQFE